MFRFRTDRSPSWIIRKYTPSLEVYLTSELSDNFIDREAKKIEYQTQKQSWTKIALIGFSICIFYSRISWLCAFVLKCNTMDSANILSCYFYIIYEHIVQFATSNEPCMRNGVLIRYKEMFFYRDLQLWSY